MIYLDSMELLNYALQKLNAGKREQVPVRDLPEIQEIISVATQKLMNQQESNLSINYKIALNDTQDAIQTAQCLGNMVYLTEAMKDALVSGITRLKFEISEKAWNYYHTHSFDVNENTIPVMRDIVATHLLGGE